MATAGPELPAHLLAKRKRKQEIQAPRPATPSKSRSPSPTSGNTSASKRRRILGPSLPPNHLSERPSEAPEPDSGSDNSSDSDDLGPSLPPGPGSTKAISESQRRSALATSEAVAAALAASQKPQREEWMLIPPKSDDCSARQDPTKLKNRKFNTGKGSKAPPTHRTGGGGGGIDSIWTETPEQKRQRLEDEIMGVKKPAQLGPGDTRSSAGERESVETDRRIREYNVRVSSVVQAEASTNISLNVGKEQIHIPLQRPQNHSPQRKRRRSQRTGFRQGERRRAGDENWPREEKGNVNSSGGFRVQVREGKISIVQFELRN